MQIPRSSNAYIRQVAVNTNSHLTIKLKEDWTSTSRPPMHPSSGCIIIIGSTERYNPESANFKAPWITSVPDIMVAITKQAHKEMKERNTTNTVSPEPGHLPAGTACCMDDGNEIP